MSSLTSEEALYPSHHRWGWQYVEPPETALSRLFYEEPARPVVAEPEVWPLQQKYGKLRKKLVKRIVIVVLLAIILGSLTKGSGAIFALILAAIWFTPMINTKRKIKQLKSKHESDLQEADQLFSLQARQWDQSKRDELQRNAMARDAANLWFPVASPPEVDRVDIFGGAPKGWPHLLTHLTSHIVGQGSPTTVLDFTESDVTAPLMDLARPKGNVSGLQVPRDMQYLNLLGGLSAEDAAEVLGEALQTLRMSPDRSLRMLDGRILEQVTQAVQDSLTTRRVLAGVKVLMNASDADDDTVLAPSEVSILTRTIDRIDANTDSVRSELAFIRDALQLLVSKTGATPEVSVPLLPSDGLVVVATADTVRMRKDFFDRVIFQALMQNLKAGAPQSRSRLIVIAGADHLGLESLEEFARIATRHGVRLVYLFEHLRGDTLNLLGAGHSASVIMRLGNANEAAAAAEYIGRGHSFKLSQMSRQVGIAATNGGGTTSGFTTNVSNSSSTSHTASEMSSQYGTSASYSEAIGTSLQSMTNWSTTQSMNDTATNQRVYEFAVEPTVIQSLPETALIMVAGGEAGRQVLVADCNPAIAMLARVSTQPFEFYTYPNAQLLAVNEDLGRVLPVPSD